jgi:hypothetical protein
MILVPLHEVANEGSGIVRGGIVNDDHAVVIVVLVEDGLKVKFVTKVLGVIIGRHHDTERQFSGILTHVVDGLQPLFFFF